MPANDPFPFPLDALDGPHAAARRTMLLRHLWARHISDQSVLRAMARVPREAFIDPSLHGHAYDDAPLAIGFGQTISQPYMVARMSELAEIKPGDRVLEIGFGSGYQTAILLELGAEVWGLELEPALANATIERLTRLGYTRAHLRAGDGNLGWPDDAPFDAILIAAAALKIPPALPPQLAEGGRLLAPIGPPDHQRLLRLRRINNTFQTEDLMSVRFVPLRDSGASG